MKTLEIKLKKDVLIVDLGDIDITEEMINNKVDNIILADYQLICKGSELTEEIASELVEKSIHNNLFYKQYNKIAFNNSTWFHNPIHSFMSAIVSKGYNWLENPCKYLKSKEEIFADKNKLCRYISKEEKLHLEAEEKTFKNPLIFVKK